MIIVIYSIIILFATTIGAISGLGGGVIIKPLFDFTGIHNMTEIGFYSSVAVFTMCIVSILKQLKNKFSFDIKTVVWVSLGSLIGGILGENIFKKVATSFENNQVKFIQSSLLAITLVLILIYTLNKSKIKSFKTKNVFLIFLVGLFLGAISVFLGIGGGPLNIALLTLMFSYTMKEATVYSIATIFFSQFSKLINNLVSGKYLDYDLYLLPFIIIFAISGGFIGTIINQRLTSKKIEKVYIVLMLSLLVLSTYNIISSM